MNKLKPKRHSTKKTVKKVQVTRNKHFTVRVKRITKKPTKKVTKKLTKKLTKSTKKPTKKVTKKLTKKVKHVKKSGKFEKLKRFAKKYYKGHGSFQRFKRFAKKYYKGYGRKHKKRHGTRVLEHKPKKSKESKNCSKEIIQYIRVMRSICKNSCKK